MAQHASGAEDVLDVGDLPRLVAGLIVSAILDLLHGLHPMAYPVQPAGADATSECIYGQITT
ncbi:hypothetical protein D3C83_184900 [compost metagenome]